MRATEREMIHGCKQTTLKQCKLAVVGRVLAGYERKTSLFCETRKSYLKCDPPRRYERGHGVQMCNKVSDCGNETKRQVSKLYPFRFPDFFVLAEPARESADKRPCLLPERWHGQ